MSTKKSAIFAACDDALRIVGKKASFTKQANSATLLREHAAELTKLAHDIREIAKEPVLMEKDVVDFVLNEYR